MTILDYKISIELIKIVSNRVSIEMQLRIFVIVLRQKNKVSLPVAHAIKPIYKRSTGPDLTLLIWKVAC